MPFTLDETELSTPLTQQEKSAVNIWLNFSNAMLRHSDIRLRSRWLKLRVVESNPRFSISPSAGLLQITITRDCLQDLPAGAMEYFLAHEFGHLAACHSVMSVGAALTVLVGMVVIAVSWRSGWIAPSIGAFFFLAGLGVLIWDIRFKGLESGADWRGANLIGDEKFIEGMLAVRDLRPAENKNFYTAKEEKLRKMRATKRNRKF